MLYVPIYYLYYFYPFRYSIEIEFKVEEVKEVITVHNGRWFLGDYHIFITVPNSVAQIFLWKRTFISNNTRHPQINRESEIYSIQYPSRK